MTLPKLALLALLLTAFFGGKTSAQSSLLERRVSLSLRNVSQQEALDVVAQQAGFQWSYNVRLLEAGKRVTCTANSVTVREALFRILGPGFEYRPGNGYLALKKKKNPDDQLSGYLTDPRSGQRVAGATVYDRRSLRTSTTDSEGYYELPVTARSEIVVAKLDFRDTVLRVSSETPRFLNLDLNLSAAPPPRSRTVEQDLALLGSRTGQFFLRSAQKFSTLNVRDSLSREWQLSLLPKVGTNRGMSGNVSNHWSLNLIVGYSLGNQRLEVAGVGNITRQFLHGAQVAGVFNQLGGDSDGAQFAGLWNGTGSRLSGAQFAGGCNFARRSSGFALQAAGVANAVRRGRTPAQFAGVANFADTLTGLQAAGLWSRARVLRGVQANGVWSHARRADAGVQFAGLYNSVGSGTVNGQVAAVSNSADTLRGVQTAALSNRAQVLRGVQVGLFNHAHEVRGGVQLGLLNTSKRGGYVVLEGSANELTWANLTFKSGVAAFYTSFTAGLRPDTSAEKIWAVGMGFGTRVRLTRWLGLSLDLTQRHLSTGRFDAAVQEWSQAALTFDLRLGRHLSLAFGPSANLLLADPAYADAAENRRRLVPTQLPHGLDLDKDPWLSGWVGGVAAVRVRI
jgi:hypothetical protein